MYIYKGSTVTFTTNIKVKNTTESAIHGIYKIFIPKPI